MNFKNDGNIRRKAYNIDNPGASEAQLGVMATTTSFSTPKWVELLRSSRWVGDVFLPRAAPTACTGLCTLHALRRILS